MIKVIETYYNGYRFRSRGEARWAVFFDTLGMKWEYELEGYLINGSPYLPDFWFPEWHCFGEVKPETLICEEWNKCKELPSECLIFDEIPTVKTWATTGWEESTYKWYLSGTDWGRVQLWQSKRRKRLWYIMGENVDDYDTSKEKFAVESARSARFEHGETPFIDRNRNYE